MAVFFWFFAIFVIYNIYKNMSRNFLVSVLGQDNKNGKLSTGSQTYRGTDSLTDVMTHILTDRRNHF